jgi:serine O-acetyltransferase
MIETRRQMREWIKQDFDRYKMKHPFLARFTYGEHWEMFSYVKTLRHLEYYTNKRKKYPWDFILKAFYWLKHRRNCKKMLINISPNTCGPGFHLVHRGFRRLGAYTQIGSNCNVLPNVLFGMKSPNAPLEGYVIGDNCLINTGVTILGPVTIGNNVTIAAGAVVTKDIPDNCIVAGVPAKIIKIKE